MPGGAGFGPPLSVILSPPKGLVFGEQGEAFLAENSPHMTEPTRRPKRRGCGFALALTFGLSALLWVLATWYTGAQFSAELERLRRAGEPLELADLFPQVPAGEQNAADLYLQAFASLCNTGGYGNVSGVPSGKWSKQDWAAARTFLGANQHYFALLDRATRLKHCVFPVNPNLLFPNNFSTYAAMREAARALFTRAEVQVADGQTDAALQSCAATIKLAERTQAFPELIGAMVYAAVQGMGLDEMERVLSAGDPSAEACRALYPRLDDSAWKRAWVHAMQADRAYLLGCFGMFEDGVLDSQVVGSIASKDGLRYNLHLTLGRPLWNEEKLANLETATKRISMMELPWAQATRMRDEILAQEALFPKYYTETTRFSPSPATGLPMTFTLLWHKMEGSARLRAAQIALAAKAYKGEHGAYPASLADLTQDGWKLPLDPFTDQPYRYQQVGGGFIVYSVGPDLTDNGGTNFDWNRFKPDQPGYDFVFRVAR